MESRHKVQDKLNLKRGLKSKKGKNTDRGFLFFMFWESWTGTKYILYSVPLQTQHFVVIVLHYSCFKSCIVSRLDASSNFLGWSKIHARVIQQFENDAFKIPKWLLKSDCNTSLTYSWQIQCFKPKCFKNKIH